MHGTRKKVLIGIVVAALFLFCAVQVLASTAAEEGTVEVLSAGKVPVDYMEPDAYSESRIAEGKAVFEEKCAICHSQSGRDMVYFGDPDFNAGRVAGSVKKFAGAMSDPELGEKVYEYLRYNNDGPFQSQDKPFLQPGPKALTLGDLNPILSEDEDFWGALTGHRVPTPDDVNLETMWGSYDMTQVTLPYPIASWSEFMPHEVPLPAAMEEVWELFDQQNYNLDQLPLPDKGMGLMFNWQANSVIYPKYQFTSHDYFKMDHSKDMLEAVYSTSLLCMLGVLDFEYGLPQRVDGEWNGAWEWGPYENSILWGPGSNLDNLNSYSINPTERINSREAYRNKWTQYSTMFVTGPRGDFQPSSYYWYATMPWGCKTFDAGMFGGANVQIFTGMKGFAEMWKHSQTYTAPRYAQVMSFGAPIRDYGKAVRKYLIDMYWQYEGLPYYAGDKSLVVNPFLEMIYRQWTAAIGTSDQELRTLISDSYNLPDGDRDAQRFSTLVGAYNNLKDAMTKEQQDLVVAYIRRLYPVNPQKFDKPFTVYGWEAVANAPKGPVMAPFGDDTAIVGEAYQLRILRAQAADGDVTISATDLPKGAELVVKEGNWRENDKDYAIAWTPTADQAGKTYTIKLKATGASGESELNVTVKVAAKAEALTMADIPAYSVYAGQELSFPLTVENYKVSDLQYTMEGDFGTVIQNAWNTAGIYTLNAKKADVGVHEVKFTVTDAQGNTSSKTAKIEVKDNNAPVVTMTPTGAGPGGNKNIYHAKVGETLRLFFDVNDPDGDRVEISKNAEFPGTVYGTMYSYTVTADMAKNFPGPNVLTFYIKDLETSDNIFAAPSYKGGEAKKVLLVYFEPADADDNHNPWAVAGNPQVVTSGDLVTLNGSGSDDTDGDPITLLWSQQTGPNVTLSDTASATPTFTAPTVTEPTIMKFYLKASDPSGLTDAGVVRILVNPK